MAAAAFPGATIDEAELLGLRALAARRGARRTPRHAAGAAGTIAARVRGRGLDIDDVRPWAAGDDLRHLDRNATARSGQPHVRRFRDERDRAVLLLADFRPSMLFGTRGAFRSVAAARALALAGWRAAITGARVGLLAALADERRYLRPAPGEAGMRAVIGALAHAHECAWAETEAADPPLTAALEAACSLIPRDGLVIVASAFETPGAGSAAALLALRRRGALRVLLVRDAFEQQPPRGEYPFLRQDGRASWGAVGRKRAAQAPAAEAWLANAGIEAEPITCAAPLEALASALQESDGSGA